MDKNIIIGILAIIVIIGGLVWFGRPSSNNQAAGLALNSNGVLRAEETDFDFGSISMAAGNVRHAFRIKNVGSEAVTIGKMYTSCMCTTAYLAAGDKKFGPYGMPGHGFIPKINETVNPGEEAEVEIVFDPAAHGPAGVGEIQRVVTIENNGRERLELQFSAMVTP
ncbi:MAG: DUF1573 domain-containing protein [Candidatus Sungbacteria bacterium]|nr:DUF1573 domain-containing protein [Candidatus Sungbacteria bacterium]